MAWLWGLCGRKTDGVSEEGSRLRIYGQMVEVERIDGGGMAEADCEDVDPSAAGDGSYDSQWSGDDKEGRRDDEVQKK